MRIRFLIRHAFSQGGLTLAVFRLAKALEEAGHDASVLVGEGEPPPELHALARRVEHPLDAAGVSRALEREAPDLVLICEDSPEWLRASASVAPTLLHAHMHWGVCADAARYWNRLARPCAVQAGWRCTALRPLLGCSDLRRTIDPRHVARQVSVLGLLADGLAGVACVGTDQAELYASHGAPSSRIAVVPNLGIRMTGDELHRAAVATPERWRRAVAFFGRLTKAKGAALLPRIAELLGDAAPLRVFGEGYLGEELTRMSPGSMCGQIAQPEVAGVLMWARAVVFPSLWPEPGGIVGVDAQIMGVPLAAFDVGAARFWPVAELFANDDVEGMAAWSAAQAAPRDRRDPEAAAADQARYWTRIGDHASNAFATFAGEGAFEVRDSPAEALMGLAGRLEPGAAPKPSL